MRLLAARLLMLFCRVCCLTLRQGWAAASRAEACCNACNIARIVKAILERIEGVRDAAKQVNLFGGILFQKAHRMCWNYTPSAGRSNLIGQSCWL